MTQTEEEQAYQVLAQKFECHPDDIRETLIDHFDRIRTRVCALSMSTYQGQEEKKQAANWTAQELRRAFAATADPSKQVPRDEVPGIPPGVDAIDWYRAWEKMKNGGQPQEKQTKKEDEKDYFKEVLYQIYRISGYSVGESIHVAYTKGGQEIMRYLARHAPSEDESSALPESPTF